MPAGKVAKKTSMRVYYLKYVFSHVKNISLVLVEAIQIHIYY